MQREKTRAQVQQELADSAAYGKLRKLSNDSRFSSPGLPASWPSRIRAAVTVLTPMPSPTNRITFLAGRLISRTDLLSWMNCWPAYNQSFTDSGP